MFTYALLRNANKTLWDNSATKIDMTRSAPHHDLAHDARRTLLNDAGVARKDGALKMTPKEAADWAGVSKSTILRAIRNGKLSAKKNDEGVNIIDPSELNRWNESRAGVTVKKGEAHDTGDAERTPVNDARRTPSMARHDTVDDTGDARVLSVKVEMMQAQIDLLMSERDDLRQQRNEAQAKRDEAQTKLTALLTDQRTDKEPEQPKRRRWWQVAVFL